MTVSQDAKDYIVTHFDDFTAKELADKFKISKSTVTRIIQQGRDDAAKMKADAKESAGANAEEKKADSKPGEQPNDDFEWSPDTEERKVIELEADDNLHKLLRSAPQNDLDEEGDDAGVVTDAKPEEEATKADKSSVQQVMEQLTEPDDQEIDNLLSGLLGPGDPLAEKKPAPTRRKATAQSKAQPASRQVAMATTASTSRPPASVLVAQIKLYVLHFGQQLESICGRVGSSEQEKWLKQITVKTNYDELCGHLSALRGVLVILNGVNMIRSSVMCGCGLTESTAPYIGMNMSGLTEELAQKQDELQLISTQMCIDDYDFYAQKMSPKHQLFMLVSSTAFACHNRNQQLAAQFAQQQAQQLISTELQEKYEPL